MAFKRKKEMNLMKDEEFFQKIAEKCNYINTDLVKQVYYEMVRFTSSELRSNGAIRYPSLGDFWVTYNKEKNIIDVNTHKKIKIPMKKVIKFTVNEKLRKYFISLS